MTIGYSADTMQRARATAPDFPWAKFNAAQTRILECENHPERDIRSEKQKMEDQQLIEAGRKIIDSTSDYEDYLVTVWSGYQGLAWANESRMKALTKIAYHYGLNPSPGLDLIYMYIDEKSGRNKIEISYKGWLAKVAELRQSLMTSYEITDPEDRKKHGLSAGDIGYITEIIPLDIADKLAMAKAAGFNADPERYKIIGFGCWRTGYTVPKGRTAVWVARKNSMKDAAMLALVGWFSLNMPQVDGMHYDRESDGWVSNEVVEGVFTVTVPEAAKAIPPTETPVEGSEAVSPDTLPDEPTQPVPPVEPEPELTNLQKLILQALYEDYSDPTLSDHWMSAAAIASKIEEDKDKVAACLQGMPDWVYVSGTLATEDETVSKWSLSYEGGLQLGVDITEGEDDPDPPPVVALTPQLKAVQDIKTFLSSVKDAPARTGQVVAMNLNSLVMRTFNLTNGEIEKKRREFLELAFNVKSANDLSPEDRAAIVVWVASEGAGEQLKAVLS